MKKRSFRALVCVMTVVLGLAVAACGGNKYSSLEDYINSDSVQEQLESVKEQAEESGMSIDITADGNKLTYTYTLLNLTAADGIADPLQEALDAQASSFESLASDIENESGFSDIIVSIVYLDANGELLCERDFSAQ